MRKVLLFFCMLGVFTACGSYSYLSVSDVSYQSIRPLKKNLAKKIPSSARIAIIASVTDVGEINISVKNLTSSVMSIDKTKSFFVYNGVSKSFYDPNIQVSSTSTTNTRGVGSSFNLGVAANILGIGGTVGAIMDGTTIGSNRSVGTTVSSSTYSIDQPIISLAPNSFTWIGDTYSVNVIGINYLKSLNSQYPGKSALWQVDKGTEMMFPFSITITYRLEGEKEYKSFTSSFFISDIIKIHVNGGKVNNAVRTLLSNKKSFSSEMWYMIYLANGDVYSEGFLYDYE